MKSSTAGSANHEDIVSLTTVLVNTEHHQMSQNSHPYWDALSEKKGYIYIFPPTIKNLFDVFFISLLDLSSKHLRYVKF